MSGDAKVNREEKIKFVAESISFFENIIENTDKLHR